MAKGNSDGNGLIVQLLMVAGVYVGYRAFEQEKLQAQMAADALVFQQQQAVDDERRDDAAILIRKIIDQHYQAAGCGLTEAEIKAKYGEQRISWYVPYPDSDDGSDPQQREIEKGLLRLLESNVVCESIDDRYVTPRIESPKPHVSLSSSEAIPADEATKTTMSDYGTMDYL